MKTATPNKPRRVPTGPRSRLKKVSVLLAVLASWVALACSGSPGPEEPQASESAAEPTLGRSGEPMKSQDISAIEAIRAQYEARLMATPGVVMVSLGLCDDDQPCLKIGTSEPVAEVRDRLPEEIFDVPIELEYLGEIKAQ